MPGFTTTFFDEGKEHTLSVSRYWVVASPKGLQSKSIFAVMVNNYHLGYLARGETGIWYPLGEELSSKRLFEFTSDDYQAIGEMIEDNLPGQHPY